MSMKNLSYFELVKQLKEVKLCIVGRDPYPNSATSIPFCKKSWDEFDGRTSGTVVLKSLLGVEKNCFSKIKEPKDFFKKLLKKGIVFLNASYMLLDGKSLNNKKNLENIKKAYEYNKDIFEKSENIMLTGDSYKMIKLVVEDNTMDKFIKTPHPSLQSRNSSGDKKEWDKYWSKGAGNKNGMERVDYINRNFTNFWFRSI